MSLAVDVGNRALGNTLVDSAGGSRLSGSRGLGSSAGENGEGAGDDGSRETHFDFVEKEELKKGSECGGGD